MSIMDNSSSTHGKILIIEDDVDIRNTLKVQLERAGYHVIEANDGKEGIELMKKKAHLLQVGLIITNTHMPKVDDIETIDYIKANAPYIPIMVVTDYPDAELAVECTQFHPQLIFTVHGVENYLVKPIGKDKLLRKVSAIFSSKQHFTYV